MDTQPESPKSDLAARSSSTLSLAAREKALRASPSEGKALREKASGAARESVARTAAVPEKTKAKNEKKEWPVNQPKGLGKQVTESLTQKELDADSPRCTRCIMIFHK